MPIGLRVRLEAVQDGKARVGLQAGRGKERGADVAGEERVAAAATCGRDPVGLPERVHGDAARAFEPALVAGAREGLQEPEAVPRGAVAEAVALLVSVCAGLPDQLCSREHKLLVEVVPRAGEDAGGSGAPLQALRLPGRRAGPVGEAVLSGCIAREDSGGLAGKRLVRLDPEQCERVARGAVQRAQAAVVVILPPETVLAASRSQL